MKKIQTLLLATLLLISVACNTTEGSDSGKLEVVATTGQIADAVANVAGDAVSLTGLLGPGIDPHLYVPTEGDVSTFRNADVIFYNGLHLEAQMLRVLEQMAEQGRIVVALGDNLPADRLIDVDAEQVDPHVWNDPELWSLGVELVRDTLIEADPDNADAYRENADAYLKEIADTHTYVQTQLDTIPDNLRVMITAHDAFAYFGRTYNMEVAGLQGISTESEASTSDVQNLANFIVERGIPAMFVETSVSPRTIESVQAAVRAQGHEVAIGGQLFSDALGEEGHSAETYTGMLRWNADTLAEALGK